MFTNCFPTCRSRALAIALLCAGIVLTGCHNEETQLPGSGTWRLINYWAIWCKPCREEIPELNMIDQNPEITVLGVNYDKKTGDELEEHIKTLGITFESLSPTTYPNPAETLGTERPQVLPTTLVVNPEGKLVGTLLGPQTTEKIEKALREHGASVDL